MDDDQSAFGQIRAGLGDFQITRGQGLCRLGNRPPKAPTSGAGGAGRGKFFDVPFECGGKSLRRSLTPPSNRPPPPFVDCFGDCPSRRPRPSPDPVGPVIGQSRSSAYGARNGLRPWRMRRATSRGRTGTGSLNGSEAA